MLKILKYNKKNSLENLNQFLSKRKLVQKSQTFIVNKIINNVKKNGDKAVLNYEKKFSNIKKNRNNIVFTNQEIKKIIKKIDKGVKQAIDLAYKRIKKFHAKQKFLSYSFKDKYNNTLSYKYTALEKLVFMCQEVQQATQALC